MTTYYTGRGDKGSSRMGQTMIAKDDPIFEMLGTLDELNSWVGLCRIESAKLKALSAKREKEIITSTLRGIQETLFIAQAEIAAIGLAQKAPATVTAEKTADLEAAIKKIDGIVPTLKNFIIPGASELSARLDVTRAVTRRAERAFVVLSKARKSQKISPELLQYLNRLSSILFALGRLANVILKVKEEHPSYK